MSDGMPCLAEVRYGSSFFPLRRRYRTLLLLFLLVVLLAALGGCGSKQISGKNGPLIAGTGESSSTVYLPADDGISLSSAEREALASTGELDRGIAQEDMRDVILHFKYFVHKDRYTVEKNLERAQPYMPFIRSVFREKGLPEELAYIAFIESGYDPMARSRTGATGMWQFISSTGKYYGMQQDWWMDERRDPYQATRAAADYLARLYKLFDDWSLAITAYNAGEGKITRGLAATGTRNFFALRRRNESIYSQRDRLSEENQQYYPKFVAVCKIMRNLKALGFSVPDPSRSPKVVELRARPGTDLKALAQSVGMNWDEFFAHNPACQRFVSHPGRFTKVYVPSHAATQARSFLSRPPASRQSPGWTAYTVVRGDTMTRIARKTGVPVAELRRLNQVNEPLRIGYRLRIPGSARGYVDTRLALVEPVPVSRATVAKKSVVRAASSAGARARKVLMHEVAAGDTVYSLSRRYGVSQEALLAANGMTSNALYLGQKLKIPGDNRGRDVAVVSARKEKQAAAAPARTGTMISSYRVQPGDSLWAIARKFNMPPSELLALNNMTRESLLKPGDVIRVQQ